MSEVQHNKIKMDSLLPVAKKVAPGFLKALYSDVAQPGLQVIGKSLANVMDFCAIPTHLLQYLSDSVKINLAHRLKEYGKKLEAVPEDKRCPVDPQIGAPIIDHLRTTTNDEIADMFTTLLANASNLDTLDKAHPSFTHLVSQLSVDEARIIKYLKNKDDIQYCSFQVDLKDDGGFISLIKRATLISDEIELTYPENVAVYLSNLVSLGILEDREGTFRMEESVYKKICDKYDLSSLKEKYRKKGYQDVSYEKSYYEVTSLGRLFINACVKD